MFWWLFLLVLIGLLAYLLYQFGKRADEIEDDSAHMYEHRPRAAYGTKFLNIIRGRGDG